MDERCKHWKAEPVQTQHTGVTTLGGCPYCKIDKLESALDWLMEFLEVDWDYGPTDDPEIAAIIKAVQKRSPLSAGTGNAEA